MLLVDIPLPTSAGCWCYHNQKCCWACVNRCCIHCGNCRHQGVCVCVCTLYVFWCVSFTSCCTPGLVISVYHSFLSMLDPIPSILCVLLKYWKFVYLHNMALPHACTFEQAHTNKMVFDNQAILDNNKGNAIFGHAQIEPDVMLQVSFSLLVVWYAIPSFLHTLHVIHFTHCHSSNLLIVYPPLPSLSQDVIKMVDPNYNHKMVFFRNILTGGIDGGPDMGNDIMCAVRDWDCYLSQKCACIHCLLQKLFLDVIFWDDELFIDDFDICWFLRLQSWVFCVQEKPGQAGCIPTVADMLAKCVDPSKASPCCKENLLCNKITQFCTKTWWNWRPNVLTPPRQVLFTFDLPSRSNLFWLLLLILLVHRNVGKDLAKLHNASRKILHK